LSDSLAGLLALRSAPPAVGAADAERAAREIYGLIVRIRPLPGERDCNFHAVAADGQAYVLKVIALGTAEASADCQVRVLRHLAQQDASLPVPRLHATVQGRDLGELTLEDKSYATCLLSYLAGDALSAHTPTAPLRRDVGRVMARIDRALQGFFHAALGQRLAWDVRRLPSLSEFCSYIDAVSVRRSVQCAIELLGEALPRLHGLRCQAIHGDGHAGNLLVSGAGTVCGLVDFGDIIHGPLVLEPAVAMSELLTSGLAEPQDLLALLEGYLEVQPLESADIDVLHALVAARHATAILIHAWRRRHDPDGARALDAAAARAAPSLDHLLDMREALTLEWHRAAGTAPARAAFIDLGRRHRLLGAGADLFYDRPLHIVRGEGVWLYDADGRAHLDAYNNVPHVGHCHPAVVGAIQRQAAVLSTHTRYLHDRVLEYAERLLEKCPPHLEACIFVNSGSEANDVAWRLAKFATGHGGALIMAHAYHGITDAVSVLTPGAGQTYDDRVATLSPPPASFNVATQLGAPDRAAAVRTIDEALAVLEARGFAPAAFFLDTAMTSSGIYDPPPAWLDEIAARVRGAGGLVVADEVQYGLGRSGSHFWGFERRGLTPDIVTLGKPIGNGYPMGAVIASRHLIESFQRKFGFFSTFGGNPVAASAGLAVLQVIERESLVANAARTGLHLRQRLEALASKHDWLGAVRGSGLLLGLEITAEEGSVAKRRARQIVNALASRARVLIGSEGPGGNILKLRPPLPFALEHADLLVDAIGAAAAAIEAGS